MGCPPPFPKRKSVEIKPNHSFGAFKTFPEPCRTAAGGMRLDVEVICLFCNFAAIPQALHVQPSRRDKVATGEKVKAKAGCQKELFKVDVQVAEKLNIPLGVCLSGKNQNQSTLPRKPRSAAKY